MIHSLHKTLPSMTQTSLIHLCSDRVSRELFVRFLGIYQTSSPSYVLMASMDACLDQLKEDGDRMFSEYIRNLERTRERLGKCRYIRLENTVPDPAMGIYDVDRSKLIFSTVHSTLNGKQLTEILRSEFHLEMEMEAESYTLALTSVGDREEGFERLCSAIEEIDKQESLKYTENIEVQEKNKYQELNQIMKISQAMDALTERIPLEESIGRVSAEFAYLYPPGIPLLVPGEQITGLLIKNMRRYVEQGFDLQGLSDVTNGSVLIVANEMREASLKKTERAV